MTIHKHRQPEFNQNTVGQSLSELEQIDSDVVRMLDHVIEQPTSKLRQKLLSSIVEKMEMELVAAQSGDENGNS